MTYTYKYPRPALTVDCVVFGLDDEDLKILLIQRKHDPFAGCWALPGGFVDVGETPEHAARRELDGGERDVEALEDVMALHLASADAVDYAEVRTVPELERPARAEGSLLLAVAAHVGGTRLIDNLVLAVDGATVREETLLEEPGHE